MQLLCLTSSLLSLLRLVYSIKVASDSKCFPLCGDDINDSNVTVNSWTGRDMLVCEDGQLAGPNSTVQGRKWKECLSCEVGSKAVNSSSNESDLYWVLCKLAA